MAPEIKGTSRKLAKEWYDENLKNWEHQNSAAAAGKLQDAVDNVTTTLIGSEGLHATEWRGLPMKLAHNARANVGRGIALERLKMHLYDWDRGSLLQQAERHVRHQSISKARSCAGGAEMVAGAGTAATKSPNTNQPEPPKQIMNPYHRRWTCDVPGATARRKTKADMCQALAASVETKLRTMGIDMEELEQHVQQCSTSGCEPHITPSASATQGVQQVQSWYAARLLSDMQDCKRARHGMSAQLSKLAAEYHSIHASDDATTAGPGTAITLKANAVHFSNTSNSDMDRPRDDNAKQSSSCKNSSVPGNRHNTNHRAPLKSGSHARLMLRIAPVGGGSPGPGPPGAHRSPSLDRGKAAQSGPGWATKVHRVINIGNMAAEAKVHPLAVAFQQACHRRGVYVLQDVSKALVASAATGHLRLDGMSLHDAVAQCVAEVLSAHRNVQEITLIRTILNAESLAALLPVLRQIRLRSLQLQSNDLTHESWDELVVAMSRPTVTMVDQPSEWWMTLRHLSLSGNAISDQGLAHLVHAIVGLQALTHLDLSQTGITDWSAPQIEALLRGCTKLQHMNLSLNALGRLTGEAMAGALPDANNINHLDLSWNPLSGGLAPVLWSVLAPRTNRQCKLTHLILAGVDLQVEDHLALAALLKWGSGWLPFRKLDLSHNNLLGVGAQCLMRQLHCLLPHNKDNSRTTAGVATAGMQRFNGLVNQAFNQQQQDTFQQSQDADEALQKKDTLIGVPRLDLARTVQLALQQRASLVLMNSQVAKAVGGTVGSGLKHSYTGGVYVGESPANDSSHEHHSHDAVNNSGADSFDRADVSVTLHDGAVASSVFAGPVPFSKTATGLVRQTSRVKQQQATQPGVKAVQCHLASAQSQQHLRSRPTTAKTYTDNCSQQLDQVKTSATGGETKKGQQQQEQERAPGLSVVTIGCRVDVDGGAAPTPRVRLGAGGDQNMNSQPFRGPCGSPRKQMIQPHVAAPRRQDVNTQQQQQVEDVTSPSPLQSISLLNKLDEVLNLHGQDVVFSQTNEQHVAPLMQPVVSPRQSSMRQVVAGVGKGITTSRSHRFELNLSQQRPDHYLAQLLVEHELHARQYKVQSWKYMELDGVVYRQNGQDVLPFDVLYEGWGHPGVLPTAGVLVLEVECLPQHASPWLGNPRLQFNAARLLSKV